MFFWFITVCNIWFGIQNIFLNLEYLTLYLVMFWVNKNLQILWFLNLNWFFEILDKLIKGVRIQIYLFIFRVILKFQSFCWFCQTIGLAKNKLASLLKIFLKLSFHFLYFLWFSNLFIFWRLIFTYFTTFDINLKQRYFRL